MYTHEHTGIHIQISKIIQLTFFKRKREREREREEERRKGKEREEEREVRGKGTEENAIEANTDFKAKPWTYVHVF
jgi:hypothetical protein